ncbi:RNA polymerase recycling motor HelD [Robertmurraya massiliosenegalensis]|uniref:RNA polymerase recycling motor HelD n=1 Tax=Robertmurraya TaxID=2837507 RepID=UPI0039A5BDEB
MDSNFRQEQKRVDVVMEIITDELNRLEEEKSKRKNEVVDIRKHFWDEVKVNLDSFDDYLETIIGLRQEVQALSVSQSSHRHAAKRLSTLRRMHEVPYFGRIDLLEEGTTKPEKIYIGISTLRDPNGDDFLIYDWRAPVSSVYYDYQPGSVKYETPGGTIHGILEKKWQYLIRGGELQSMFDTSLTIGDEILQQVLGKGTDKKMHNIVATIQQEQNKIIRHDLGRLLIVHGAAGSGKTSAAMQRIAYLLYKYRDRLNADQIILFSPNTMFNSYVSNVLPELGEENMQQVTFQEYLDHRLSKDFQVETPFEQLEYVLTGAKTPSYQSRIASVQFKASTHFFEALQSYRQSLENSGMLFKDIVFRGKTIITAQQIGDRFYRVDTSLRFHNRLENLKDWLIKQIKEIHKDEWKKSWVQEEIELLSNDEYHKAHHHLAEKRGFKREEVADYEMEPKALARLIVQQKLKPLRKQIRAYRFINLTEIYKQLFGEPQQIKKWINEEVPADWPTICQSTKEMLEEGKLFYEDATPFLLLKELIEGFHINSSIRHIVVDEAQDYSPFQFEFLKRLFPAAKMTVLGDFNQAIFAHASEMVDFNTLTNLYGSSETEVINIARSYRSTKPIIEFTRRLVPNGDKIIPFERNGEKPMLIQVNNHEELHRSIVSKVTELKERGYHSIAIICKSAEESKNAYEALSEINELKLLKSTSLEYEQGVVVVPSYLSKGIEFDAVIMYDASENVYDNESLRRTFYTVCTRAMHELHLYSVGEPTSFVKDVLEQGVIQYT